MKPANLSAAEPSRGVINLPWYREVSADAWRVLRAAGLGWLFEVFDIYILALTTPALIAYFALSRADAGLITSVSAAGAIIGGIYAVSRARYGRAGSTRRARHPA